MDTLFIGQEIHKFKELASTNAYLKELCHNNVLPEGLTVMADNQTSGRGQFGNHWVSESGKNLLFSTFLKPNFLQPERQFLLNMSVCLALVDSLNELTSGFLIKWPNDILYHTKKVSGLLIENSVSGTTLDTSIIGIGLNVNQSDFNGLNDRTSIINITQNYTDRQYLLNNILEKLEARYLKLKSGQTSGLYNEYYGVLYGMEQTLKVWVEGKQLQAEIIGVEASGKLITRIDGVKRKFSFKGIRFELN